MRRFNAAVFPLKPRKIEGEANSTDRKDDGLRRVAEASRGPSIYGFEEARTTIPNGAVPRCGRFSTLHFNSAVIRILGFPTSDKALLVWLRAKNPKQYAHLKMGNLKQLKMLHLQNNKLTSVPKEIGDLK